MIDKSENLSLNDSQNNILNCNSLVKKSEYDYLKNKQPTQYYLITNESIEELIKLVDKYESNSLRWII
jgi:hypothetical protein